MPTPKAIETAAETIDAFEDKQHFLNTVYERFFQGHSVKVADTHGIVYTPQPIVDFMCASVEEVLTKEFGLTLGSPEVTIFDKEDSRTGRPSPSIAGMSPARAR
jgi:predicted helicase